MLVFTLIPVSAHEEAIGICPINSCLICQDDAAPEPEEQQAGISSGSLLTWLVNGISAQPFIVLAALTERKENHEAVFTVSREVLNISERTFSDDWGRFLRRKDGNGWLSRLSCLLHRQKSP